MHMPKNNDNNKSSVGDLPKNPAAQQQESFQDHEQTSTESALVTEETPLLSRQSTTSICKYVQFVLTTPLPYTIIFFASLQEASYCYDFTGNPYTKWVFACLGEFSNLYSGSIIIDFTKSLLQTTRKEYNKFFKSLCSCRGVIFIASSILVILPTSFLTSFSEKGMADQEFAGNTFKMNFLRLSSTISSMAIEFLVDTIINGQVLYNLLLSNQNENSEDQLSAVAPANEQERHHSSCSKCMKFTKFALYAMGSGLIIFPLMPNEFLGAKTFSQSMRLNIRTWSLEFISLVVANTIADFPYFFIPTKQSIDWLCSKLFCRTNSEQPKPPQSICSKVVSIVSYGIAIICTGFYTIALIEMADKNSGDSALRIIKTLLAASQAMLSVPYFLGIKDTGVELLQFCFKKTGAPEPEKEKLLPAETDSKSDSEKGEIEEKNPAISDSSDSWIYSICRLFPCFIRNKPKKPTNDSAVESAKEESKTFPGIKPCGVTTV